MKKKNNFNNINSSGKFHFPESEQEAVLSSIPVFLIASIPPSTLVKLVYPFLLKIEAAAAPLPPALQWIMMGVLL